MFIKATPNLSKFSFFFDAQKANKKISGEASIMGD